MWRPTIPLPSTRRLGFSSAMMGWMGPTAAVHNLFVDNLAREGIKIEVNELQNHCGVTGFSHPQL